MEKAKGKSIASFVYW